MKSKYTKPVIKIITTDHDEFLVASGEVKVYGNTLNDAPGFDPNEEPSDNPGWL